MKPEPVPTLVQSHTVKRIDDATSRHTTAMLWRLESAAVGAAGKVNERSKLRPSAEVDSYDNFMPTGYSLHVPIPWSKLLSTGHLERLCSLSLSPFLFSI